MAEYYEAYDARYRATFDAGIDIWGHGTEELTDVLCRWVDAHGLRGRRIVEFACGEGSGGVVLSDAGCGYLGADISPFVVKRAGERLQGYKNAGVVCMDLVRNAPEDKFDAAVDISGLHMLVVDAHRTGYLRNMRRCLHRGAPALFHAEAFREDQPTYRIDTLEKWADIVQIDFSTPQEREMNGRRVMLPTLPARPLSREGYEREFAEAGFIIEKFEPMNMHEGIYLAVQIQARAV